MHDERRHFRAAFHAGGAALVRAGLLLLLAVSAAPVSAGNGEARSRFSLLAHATPLRYEYLSAFGPAVPGPVDEPFDSLLEVDLRTAGDAGVLSPRFTGELLRGEGSARGASKPQRFSVGDRWDTQFRYHHAMRYELLPGDAMRSYDFNDFSTDPDRDVVDLKLSWRGAGSSLGLGYRLQSARGGDRFDPLLDGALFDGDDRVLHSLTLGITRRWGGDADVPHR